MLLVRNSPVIVSQLSQLHFIFVLAGMRAYVPRSQCILVGSQAVEINHDRSYTASYEVRFIPGVNKSISIKTGLFSEPREHCGTKRLLRTLSARISMNGCGHVNSHSL